MANFTNETFMKHDDYMTPKSAWQDIRHLIPKNKTIWECFYGDGKSGQYLTELGFQVIHEPIDFFQENRGDIVVSNPPFTKCPEVLARLKELDKPFVLIMPSSKINTQYMRKLFCGDQELQIIIPAKRIQFDKIVNGKKSKTKSACNFDCFYYCYKIGLQNSITWLTS